MSKEKQYAERDLMGMDVAGNHYCRHISAMTREQLHSKSDIAAELGWRDLQIAELKAQRDALAAENDLLRAKEAEAKIASSEQQERGKSLWEKMGMTDEDKYKIPKLPEEVTAQDMRETLNVLLHEEEAQSAATGFNQCLMECAPIYDAALRSQKVIDRLITELDEMQESWNYNHTNSVRQRKRAEAAEAKLAEMEKQEPVEYLTIHQGCRSPDDCEIYSAVAAKGDKSDDGSDAYPVYARPAPAINLAELVPCAGFLEETSDESMLTWQRGWNACRAAILRNIEEAK